jgi:hypothetical protein
VRVDGPANPIATAVHSTTTRLPDTLLMDNDPEFSDRPLDT